MDHFKHIYTHKAAEYHQMIAPEDATGNLLPALKKITSLKGQRILDLGTGTGRLPLLLGSQASQITGLDLHTGMLQENLAQRRVTGGNWGLVQGNIMTLPFPTAWADVVTAGWAIGHFQSWFAADWPLQVDRALVEMERVVKPGGAVIIIETLGTGSLTPTPPSEGLAAYYAHLEKNWNFTRQEIRTDFQFANVAEAVAQTEFFFGPEMAAAIREQGWATVPEWTGVWGKRL